MAYIDTKYIGECETCRHHRSGKCDTWCDCGECYQPDMSNIPTADVVEVKHSQWHMYSYDEAMCWNCGYVRMTPFESSNEAKANWHTLPKYCEECGAKMDGGKIDEETPFEVTECNNFKNKADFVEVVYCKECEWSVKRVRNNEIFPYQCLNTIACGKPRRALDFCSYGERREERGIMAKLLPCPFCGGEATHGAEVIFSRSGSRNPTGATVVRCSAMCWGKCRANMSFEYVADKTVKNPTQTGMRLIAKQWNTRTPKERGGEK